MVDIKSEEILTYLCLIVVGYFLAKMFSLRCDGFSVGGQPECRIYNNNMNACNNSTMGCAYQNNSQQCVETELLSDKAEAPPPVGMNERPFIPTEQDQHCIRNIAQGLNELGSPRSNQTYNQYCKDKGEDKECFYSNYHDEHTCRSCKSIDLTNVADDNDRDFICKLHSSATFSPNTGACRYDPILDTCILKE